MGSKREFVLVPCGGGDAASNCAPLLLAMYYGMRPDRVGWTLFDVTTGRPVVWDDVPLAGVDLDAAHELLVLLHRQHRLSQEACRPRITDKGSLCPLARISHAGEVHRGSE